MNRQTGGGVGSNSNSGSIDIPAIEITKDSDFVCDNDDYVETPSSGRRSIHQQHQQVSPIVNQHKKKLNPQQETIIKSNLLTKPNNLYNQ